MCQERRSGASPARWPRPRRAVSAAVAGMVVLAVASGGCSAGSGQHSNGSRASRSAQGAGQSRGGAMRALAGVRSGVMFGGDVPLATAESKLGRKLAIVRVYDHLGHRFGGPQINRIMAGGSTLLVSLDTLPPRGPGYAAIAAGREDAAIRSWLHEVEQSAVKYHLPAIYVSFEHEANVPSHHQGLGTPAQFVQAWDHIHQLAASAHLNWNDGGRIHWVFILTHFAYNDGQVGQFWPGTHEVDIAGPTATTPAAAARPGRPMPTSPPARRRQ